MNGPTSIMENNLNPGRRKFIATTLKATGATLVAGIPALTMAVDQAATALTVQDIINIILKEIPGAPFADTVDTIKSGNKDQRVTGIVTTMFATINVIKETARLNANFIIAHEPTFYNHADDKGWVAKNDILKKKEELLKHYDIAVWRFHDYWHTIRPDGILTGVLKMANWQQYSQPGEPVFRIPATSLKNIVEHLRNSLHISHMRVIGDLQQKCERIAVMPGAAGGQRQISLVENESPDVLIVGEVHEWETAEYIRDAIALGSKTALIILGHSVSEEPGMQWLVEWLQPKVPAIKVNHISSGDPFTWI